MKEFMLLVRVPLSYSSELAKAVGPKWDKVLENWKANDVYVTSFPFPPEGFSITGIERTIKKEWIIADDRKVVSAIVLRAATFEAALELAKDCPILDHDGSVEVREIMPRVVTVKN
ncbi:hypothetical protein QTN47_02480 [Danxiaibacter flavus]|uniref:YCII-related domain-containing protein n=1 Tax=Danxiaibacter flavus TaxID=3049108 RepID=A0ABV3ZA33_9BACT|nr:hypothetical protein QNM32_02480 [Chitinophagaceae bacterium DXS]